MKTITILINFFMLGFSIFLGIDEYPHDKEEIFFLCVFLVTPLMNIFYFLTLKQSEDSLIGLWIQVRKKKLRDQLDK